MPLIKYDGHSSWMRRTSASQRKRVAAWLGACIIVAIAFAYISQHTMWIFVTDAPRQIRDFLSRMFPPDLSYFPRIWPALWETINISIFGTGIAVALSIPLAILAAKNTSPHPVVRGIVLAIIVASRSVNSMIWALIIVQIVGPGMLASILAIAVRSLGMLSKLMYEAIEEINREPIEAITATGGSRVQVFFYGYVPQLLPSFIGTSVYRWENNIRESTIIGIVVGGGIGMLLNSAINRLAWDQVISVLIVILLTVVGSEWVSATVRKRLV